MESVDPCRHVHVNGNGDLVIPKSWARRKTGPLLVKLTRNGHWETVTVNEAAWAAAVRQTSI